MKVAVVANTTWYIHNFRRNLMASLRDAGHEVVAVATDDAYVAALREAGFRHRAVPFSGAGTNPLRELRTLLALRRVLRQERTEVVLSYTPKGNIYTAFALLGRPTRMIANISGLGRAFVQGGWLASFVKSLYAVTLRRARTVFFQNQDDLDLFLRAGLVPARMARRVRGSGVDLLHFKAVPAPGDEQGLVFLMVARLIWEKGLAEFVEAARQARTADPSLRFLLLGALDASPARGPSASEVAQWVRDGWVTHLGATDDVRPALAGAHCVVLPSYREGLPRSLLEAAAVGRPVITTDTPGCREAVEPGETGFLCQPRDAAHLAEQFLRFASLGRAERLRMGEQARIRAEREFDERQVIGAYMEAVRAAAP